MKAPRLSKELMLEEQRTAPDGAGGITTSWHKIGTLWCDLRTGSGRESGGTETAYSTTSFRIITRAAPQSSTRRPKAGQRFRDGARVMRILAVAEYDAAGFYLTCFAQEEEPL